MPPESPCCTGFYRFAHIDGRIASNPAQHARRPEVYPSEGRGLDRGEFGRFLFTAERYDPDHAALAALLGLNGLRVSEACATDAEELGFWSSLQVNGSDLWDESDMWNDRRFGEGCDEAAFWNRQRQSEK